MILNDSFFRNKMGTIKSSFTVLFEDPFWVGVYERVSDNRLEVCKITFGAEPKDNEIYDFLLNNWNKLKFSSPTKIKNKQDVKVSPKRLQREISKQLDAKGVGTKAQQALKAQQEANKIIRKQITRQQIEEEKQKMFELKQKQKKEKHKGH